MGAVLSYVPAPLDTLVEEWWGWSVRLLRSLIVRGVSLATGTIRWEEGSPEGRKMCACLSMDA